MSAITIPPSEVVEGTVTPSQGDDFTRKSCANTCGTTKTNKGAEEVVLPGYDAGIDTPGIQHSFEKLNVSAGLLWKKLQEIQTWTTGTGIGTTTTSSSSSTSTSITTQHQHQPQLLVSSEEQFVLSDEPSTLTSTSTSISQNLNLRSMITIGGMNGSNYKNRIQTFHCRDETETWTYRCRCNFQIVRVIGKASSFKSYRYAMRSMGQPVLLGTKNSFPIATLRIQTAMHDFMEHLNYNNNNNNNNESQNDNGGDSGSDPIGQNGHLTSCTFSSAWRDTPDADCVLTLHYDHPLDGDDNDGYDDGTTKRSWKRQASRLCRTLKLRQLNGRSKGMLLSVTGTEIFLNNDNENSYDDGNDDGTEATIRDTIFLLQKNHCQDNSREWEVSLDDDGDVAGALPETNSIVAIPVHYEKPETAFYHPNPNAMTTALAWMLNRLASISTSPTMQQQNQHHHHQPLRLLEMYCGCGAHTVALGRSGLVSKILAIELDPRLVRACEANVSRNSLQDIVQVKKGDAGRWAKEESRKRRSRRNRRDLDADGGADDKTNNSNNRENYYDVLLVDPPRQGLDEEVCKMAIMTIDGEVGVGVGENNSISNSEGCFRNLLYVSCGHQALLRDLERLSPVYEVVNCAQMDLFPRTDSIETLVHLRRRVEDKTYNASIE